MSTKDVADHDVRAFFVGDLEERLDHHTHAETVWGDVAHLAGTRVRQRRRTDGDGRVRRP